MRGMTSHLDHATRWISSAYQLRAELDTEYERPRPRPDHIGRLNSQLKHARELAAVHAQLAQVSATYDLRAELAELAQDLNADPVAAQLGIEVKLSPAERALALVDGRSE